MFDLIFVRSKKSNYYEQRHFTSKYRGQMAEEAQIKYWRDAGHVARRTLEAMKDELKVGVTFHEIIESAERYIHRHGGKPAFPATIAVNDLAAHFTTNHSVEGVADWDGKMVLKKGDLVKIDFGVHIKGCIGDNALTIEIGNSNNHTEQIKAAKEARDAAVEMLHPGTPWYKVGEAAAQPSIDADINSNLGNSMLEFRFHRMLVDQNTKDSVVWSKKVLSTLLNRSIQPALQD